MACRPARLTCGQSPGAEHQDLIVGGTRLDVMVVDLESNTLRLLWMWARVAMEAPCRPTLGTVGAPVRV